MDTERSIEFVALAFVALGQKARGRITIVATA
jgi:hypothetical protein